MSGTACSNMSALVLGIPLPLSPSFPTQVHSMRFPSCEALGLGLHACGVWKEKGNSGKRRAHGHLEVMGHGLGGLQDWEQDAGTPGLSG